MLPLLLLTACAQEVTLNPVVAVVNGQELKLDDFNALAAYLGLGNEPDALTPPLRRAVIDDLISRAVVLQEAARLGITLDEAEISREERLLRQEMGEEAFLQTLAAQGIDYQAWQDQLRKELLLKKTLDLVLAPKVSVDGEDVRQYYQNHEKQFRRPAQILAKHAVLPTKKLAQELLKRMAAGEDMGVAAESLGAPLDDDGRPAWLSRGHMPESLEDKIFALPAGKPAGPLASTYGFHVILVLEKRPAAQVSLAEAAEEIQKTLSAQRREKLAGEWIAGLTQKADLKINQDFLATGCPQQTGSHP
ncbi:MAG: SurA N-terminal domain-containing protein [Deltaproteobacteria bacterium]|nr:SurA N-terminal domain-containing protein [Deltaproteobacteria bacterium]